MAGNQVRVGFGVTGVSKATSEVDKLKDKITGVQKAGAGGVLKGVGLGVGLGLFNQATLAVGQLGDALADAVQGAIADQESQSRLRASLQANLPAWKGNTDAIEANILAKQRLGFDDETLRDSLTVLVGATHDLTKAQQIQNTAMDLARFKGIDLRTASEALIKVEAGQYRSLKQLGIVLKEGATQQDALNAVQAVARGQAEAYSQTVAGKLVVAQTKMNEAMEALGYKLLPAVATAVDVASTGIDILSGSMEGLGEATGYANRGVIEFIPGIGELNYILTHLPESAKDADKSLGQMASNLKPFTGGLMAAAHGIDDRYIPAIHEFASETHTATRDASSDWKDFTDQLVSDAERAISDAFDPIRAKADILAAEEQLHAAESILANKSKAKEYGEARNDITTALEDEAGALASLGEKHALSKKAVEKFKKDTIAAYKAMGKTVPQDIQNVITKLEILAGYNGGAVNVNIHATVRKGVQGKVAGKRAGGGAVEGGRPYTVGEEGEETFVPANSGTVVPHGGNVTNNWFISGADVSNPNRIKDIVERARYVYR